MMPHYPEAYLESKHCKIFAHWRTPKGVSVPSRLVTCIWGAQISSCTLL